MNNLILRKKTVRCRTKKDNPTTCEKPPYAVAQRSRHIPDDDPTCKVNVDYKSPPREFRKEPNRKRYKAKIITNE